jgi:hypothetical protein
MIHHNRPSGCLPCYNGTVKNPQTIWKCIGIGAPTPSPRREWTPEPTPSPLGMPPAPTGNTSGAQTSEVVSWPARYVYLHTAFPGAEFFQDDEDTEHDTDFDPDMMSDDD